jgi:hypothetical protein
VIVDSLQPQPPQPPGEVKGPLFPPTADDTTLPISSKRTITVCGVIPTEVWNRLGRTLIPKLKMGGDLSVGLNVSVEVEADTVQGFQMELMQILQDLNLDTAVKVSVE